MPAISTRTLPVLTVLGIAVVAGLVLLLTWASVLTPQYIVFSWLAVGGLAALVWYSVRGDLLTAVLIWFVTLIAFHEEWWRVSVPYFFALTIPRIGIVVVAILLFLMVLLGRIRLRMAWPVSGAILALLTYFFISASVSGFETRSIVSVHYRLIGGYVFPFMVFVLVLHGFRTEHDFRRLAIFFAGIGAYLTFTGWCEHLGLRSLVFPRFINDPSVGIHWGRVRGPFVMSAGMGLALTFCFYSNLLLARGIVRGRRLIYLLNALSLPVIFWTKTRSVWLGFVLGAVIWIAYSRRRMTRVVAVSGLVCLALSVAVINMDNFMGTERAKGGLTDMEPILMRVGLAQLTWEIFKVHPLFGVGFGHFRDFAPDFARDPSSAAFAYGATALEHNNLLSILGETGLVGVFLYTLVIFMLLRSSFQLYRKLPSTGVGFIHRDLLVLYWILAVVYFIDGSFRETSDNPFANSLFFGLSAVPVALNYLLGPAPLHARPGWVPEPRSRSVASASNAAVGGSSPARPPTGRDGG